MYVKFGSTMCYLDFGNDVRRNIYSIVLKLCPFELRIVLLEVEKKRVRLV